MERPTCLQLKTTLQEVKSLKNDFDLGVSNIKITRNTDPIYELEKGVRDGLAEIRESLNFFLEQQIREAQSILGRDVLGPDAIEAALGFKPQAKDSSFILFSKAELERAKELGQFLILRVDKTPSGQPLTAENMNEMKGGKTKDGRKILNNISWYKNEKFFTSDVPSVGWALVSKKLIPNSSTKTYLEQTEEIVNYLEMGVYKDQLMPLKHQEAINEFNQAKEEIKELMPIDWQLAAKKLEQLKINQLFRHTLVEVLYDSLLMKEKNGECLLPIRKSRPDTTTWFDTSANSRCANGQLVGFGATSSNGAGVNTCKPNNRLINQGVLFARRF